MNSRQLTLLSVGTLAIILIATWIGYSRNPVTESSTPLYPALKGQLAKVTGVKIYKPGDQLAVTATRTDTGWSIAERNGYPADANKITSLLLGIESAKLREEKTSNPDNYPTLGVQDLTAKDATGTRVELVGSDPTANLIVGKTDASARGAYVRRVGEPKSWLVSEQLSVASDVSSWLQRELLNIGADRIQEAVVQIEGNPQYSSFKKQRADANFDVAPLPKGRELNSVAAANSVAQALVNLQLDDVRPASELAVQKTVAHASFHTFDGVVIDLSGYNVDGKQWVVAKAEFDASLARRFHLPATDANAAEKTPAAPSKPDTSLDAEIQKSQNEVAMLNKQLAPWAYSIASYKYEGIFKPLDQLLKPPVNKKK
jgi:hypothetical protein